MSSPNRTADARLAVLVLAAEDIYSAQGPRATEPAIDPRITAEWTLRGYIVGTDAILRAFGKLAFGEQRVYYGLVLESRLTPGSFAAVVRGTAGAVEWGEDFEGVPTIVGRFPGRVEAGFSAIYDSFAYRAPGASETPLISTLSAIVGGGTLIVAGHSLGSALATYLAYDAALALPGRVSLRVFASPRTGNAELVGAVAAAVPDHRHWRNPNDIVPRVPIALGYEHLPNTVDIGPSTGTVEIKSDWGSSHHLLCYIALLDDNLLGSATAAQDVPYLSSIIKHPVAA